MLTQSDPFKTVTCKDNLCKVCTTNPKLNCKNSEAVYKKKWHVCISDEEKKGLYIGETARSFKERINEHINIYDVKENWFSTNIFQKIMTGIKIRIISSCKNDAMLR